MMPFSVYYYTIVSAEMQVEKRLIMAICRIEKVKNFTVMSNYHLDDTQLSLKSIGLLSKMLRLPDDWDFSIKGLTAICRDGADSIASALKELEKHHYIKREQERDRSGHVGKMIYYVYEIPYDVDRSELNKPTFTSGRKKQAAPQRDFPDTVNPVTVNPVTEKPDAANPVSVNPDTGKPFTDSPDWENPAQINTYTQPSTNIPSTQLPRTEKPNTQENKYGGVDFHPSISAASTNEKMSRQDRLIEIKNHLEYAGIMQSNIHLDDRLENDPDFNIEEYDNRYIPRITVDMFVDLIADMYESDEAQIKVSNRYVSPLSVTRKFERLDSYDLTNILRTIAQNSPKNRRLYALTVLMNY